MEFALIHAAAIIAASLFIGVAMFQVLLASGLAFGLPFGELTMGGQHQILPKQLRIAAGFSAVLLLFTGYIFLLHTHIVIANAPIFPTDVLVWVITGYMGLHTLANLSSKSWKERLVMTPLSGLIFALGLFIACS